MVKKLFLWLKSLDQRIKFILVGCLNTGISLIVEFACYILMGIPFSLNAQKLATPTQVLIATLSGYTAGGINSYFWNKFFTFEVKGKSASEVVRFFILFVAQVALSFALKELFIEAFGINTFISAVITTLITMLLSYFGQTTFAFRTNKKKKDTAPETPQEKE